MNYSEFPNSSILIEYGAVKNKTRSGFWLPAVWLDGGRIACSRGYVKHVGYTRDCAVNLAQAEAVGAAQSHAGLRLVTMRPR